MSETNEAGEVVVRRFLARPPSPRMLRFVEDLQETVLHGGNKHVRWPRGKGKSTWVKIAALWALVYAHRRFVVIIAATMPMAEETVTNIWDIIARDAHFAESFPEYSKPCDDVDGASQRMRLQTYHGVKTEITNNTRFHYIRFARLDGFPNTGGIISWRGASQAIRGLNVSNTRPDFVFVDDPQTDEQAKSATQVAKIEDNINGAIMGLSGTGATMAAVMASTPIEPDDVSSRFADEDRHPEWNTTTETFVVKWGPEEWVERYLGSLRSDNHKHDGEFKLSRAFYKRNRAKIEAGAEMMDDGDFDPKIEVSAYQHALNRLHVMKKKRFFSEMQMVPSGLEFAVQISASIVESRVGDTQSCIVPDGFDFVVASTDINPSYALTTAVIAFRSDCTARVITHFVERIKLDDSANDTAFSSSVFDVLARHASKVKSASPSIRVWGIDCGGKQWIPVNEFRKAARKYFHGVVMPMAGRSNKMFNPRVSSRIEDALNNTVRCGDKSKGHLWLAWNADVYKEKAQRAWLSEVGAPGGLSLCVGLDHSDFAYQIANERLIAVTSRGEYAWKTQDPHDYGDCVAMCYALAGANKITGEDIAPRVKHVKSVTRLKARVSCL